ncbi:FMN-binding glutamate synthase family protein (plasmid) [Pseudorhodobacter turbinis]|uniref:FMN-binding glutamate synthase family protein n=1 Tax=Pseudorhodobacter turbinis TaxID=2500533 RepID=A0A4P8EK35_9RHOB|nr:FMN-binding glutamate synthase family protein [Pseudorhodobacter turbinis]QCO57560.1 FMN-binding glutamate synthase family protein [Pseudorhodobacter turbinis]
MRSIYFQQRYGMLAVALIATIFCGIGAVATGSGWFILFFVISAAFFALGIRDVRQARHAVLRNYPIIGHIRYLMEAIRPEIRQYLLESDRDEEPFSRETRSLVYQRAKGVEDKKPFGTSERVYESGYAWVTHSVVPKHITDSDFRVQIGGKQCLHPYNASIYNISAMSFGALSANAIKALNTGAKLGGFAHDTGEGGISSHHRQGGDMIFQVASGYFGCRDSEGRFDPEKFAVQAVDPHIKMIEIKLSQGAKPGHGGMLPASKISAEIAETRGIPMGVDCVSPAAHSEFSTPLGLMDFIQRLRDLSGGKPVGLKLCIGHRREFMCMVKAMLETGIHPDFIVVDGKEGGTGSAPLEFANRVGMPMLEGLHFVHNTLRGAGLRGEIKIGAAGKIVTAFDIARALALGADWCNSARGFMFALGCIQAQACHTNKCPVGIATQDGLRQRALDPDDKGIRVARFHANTLKALAEIAGAAGLDRPNDFLPYHLMFRQTDSAFRDGNEVYAYLPEGFLLAKDEHPDLSEWHGRWGRAAADSFAPKEIPQGPYRIAAQ